MTNLASLSDGTRTVKSPCYGGSVRCVAGLAIGVLCVACGGGERERFASDAADADTKIEDGTVPDGAVDDAGAPDAAVADAAVEDATPPAGPARYAFGRDHSPLTPKVIDRLRTLRAQ